MLRDGISRAEAALGHATLRALRRIQRRKLGVRVHRTVDARGRVTPTLVCGTPRRATLVWVHGFSDRFDTILQAAPSLLDEFQVVSPSLPAFGEGWIDPTELHTFSAFAGWIEEVLRDLAQSGVISPSFHLVGNSLGGAIALELATRMPERVRSVVALNSAGLQLDGVHCAHHELEGGQNLFVVRDPADFERFQRRLFARPMRLPRPIVAHLFHEAQRNAGWYERLVQDLGQSEVRTQGPGWRSFVELSAVEAPTLVLWGDRDTLFPVAHGEHLARTVHEGRLELLEGVGHCGHLESPRRLATALRRWTESVG